MNIGIIIHSYTGNTLYIAEMLKEKLTCNGHTVNIERIKPVNEKPNGNKPVVLDEIPCINDYDCVIAGAPVWGFSLSPVMKLYLNHIKDKADKIKCCYVTQHFPHPFLGGNRAVKQIKKLCTSFGGDIKESAVINWSGKNRDNQIDDLLKAFSESLES